MKVLNIKDFTRGWVAGSFSPTINNTSNHELALKYYSKDDYEPKHRHMLSNEITFVVFGDVEINGIPYSEGEIIIQEKGDVADFKCLSDRAAVVAYRPDGSFPSDKEFVKYGDDKS